jgi:hypothetical protein
MKNKTKRTWLIVLGALVCIALIVGIATRFGGRTVTDPELDKALRAKTLLWWISIRRRRTPRS